MSDLVQPSTAEEARSRADRIRSGMQVLAQWQTDVIAAYAARDWTALGYETWAAYLDGEYGEHRVRLPRDQRREIVAGMAQAGMSTRAIGSAIGVDQKTVVNDRLCPRRSPTPAVTSPEPPSVSPGSPKTTGSPRTGRPPTTRCPNSSAPWSTPSASSRP
jgi:hypothetical protein